MNQIQMVDLNNQYLKIKKEIDNAISECINSMAFINGPQVKEFTQSLRDYLNAETVVPCANGTDALQIALMALNLQPGDEVIVPSFTYVATAEVIGLLKLNPVLVDVDPDTFNITAEIIEAAISPKTKAIVPVHLFGQCADMGAIMKVAQSHNLYVIEDTAQAIGADYTNENGLRQKAGTIGHVGCTSFFPSKNLGCYGDGGALYTDDKELGAKIAMIANHGQVKKYVHKYIGVNSRLDSIQAAILNVKLRFLDEYAAARNQAATFYDHSLEKIDALITPVRSSFSSHVFHQYTLKIRDGKRDQLMAHLNQKGIPCMIYYPIPLNEQEAYKGLGRIAGDLKTTKELCSSVLSLPIHTELDEAQQSFIVNNIIDFFN
jgi:UDP-2-acetamido-2-deoxy-ribo-hexuluronate aminotransferase